MSSMLPNGIETVWNSLMKWGKSGLIPDTKLANSYHAAIRDPKTGIRVDFPATVNDTTGARKSNLEMFRSADDGERADSEDANGSPLFEQISAIDRSSNNNNVGIGQDGNENIRDYNVDDALSTEKAFVNNEFSRHYIRAVVNSNSQEEYIENSNAARLADRTISSHMLRDTDISISRITDNYEAMKNFITDRIGISWSGQKEDIIQSIDVWMEDRRNEREISPTALNRNYEMFATKIPCGIPGVLNCYVDKYDLINTAALPYHIAILPKEFRDNPDVVENSRQYDTPAFSIVGSSLPKTIRDSYYWEYTYSSNSSVTTYSIGSTLPPLSSITVTIDGVELSSSGYTVTGSNQDFYIILNESPGDQKTIHIFYDVDNTIFIADDSNLNTAGLTPIGK